MSDTLACFFDTVWEGGNFVRYDLELYEQISKYTMDVVKKDMHYWKEEEIPTYQAEPKILFLGTGGNPSNLIEQVRQTGGFILYLPGFILAVDPGPAAIWHINKNDVDMRGINGIFISHGHTDHYLGAPLLIEGMTRLMSQKRGLLLLPNEVKEENLISLFHQGLHQYHEGYVGGPKEVICIQDGQEIELTSDLKLTPVKAYHGKENFGFVIKTKTFTVGYTSDTNYILEYEDQQGFLHKVDKWSPIEYPAKIVSYREDLRRIFGEVDYLIANVSYFNLFAQRHITAVGLAHLLQSSQVKSCLMTHLDACCSRPQSIAQTMAKFVNDLSGVNVVVAEDNQEYFFHQLVE